MSNFNPDYAPISISCFVAVSVSTQASADAQVSALTGFRGLYIGVTTSALSISQSNNVYTFQNPIVGQNLWIGGDFVAYLGNASVGGILGVK